MDTSSNQLTGAHDAENAECSYGYYGPQPGDDSYLSHRNHIPAHHYAPPAQYGPHSQSTVIRGQVRLPNTVAISCHNKRYLKSPITIRPVKKDGVDYQMNTRVRNDPKLRVTRYTCVNFKDVVSNISGFLCLWKHLRAVLKPLFQQFICSRRFRLTQEHVHVFINFYCPYIRTYLVGYNYRTFLDLVVKLVVDYQDAKLIRRQYVPGKKTQWGKQYLYRQWDSPKESKLPVRGTLVHDTPPPGDRYEDRIMDFVFQDYETAISEYVFFLLNTILQSTACGE